MDTQAKTPEKTVLLNLADRLVEAQRELDEFTVQLALGKAEASEKFEEIKKQFRTHLVNLKRALTTEKIVDLSKEITAKWDALEKQLNTGKVEDKAMFVAQKKLIMKSLLAFENEIKKRFPENLDAQHFYHEVENFKLKMEILRLKFELKRFAIKDDIKSNVQEVRNRVATIIDKARKKVMEGEKKIIGVKGDLKKTYQHVTKSIS